MIFILICFAVAVVMWIRLYRAEKKVVYREYEDEANKKNKKKKVEKEVEKVEMEDSARKNLNSARDQDAEKNEESESSLEKR